MPTLKKLREIAEIQTGYQFRARIQPRPDGEWAVVQIKDVDEDHTIRTPGLLRVAVANLQDNQKLRPGDVLLAARGYRYDAALVGRDLGQAIAISYFFIIRLFPDAGMLPAYLAWYLNSPAAQKYFAETSAGTLMPILTKKLVEKLEVPIAYVGKQHDFVALNELLVKEKRLVRKLLEKRQRLINLLFQKNL